MAQQSKRFRVGKWQVEPEAGQMTDGDTAIQVPPRLIVLLELLVADAGKTVSREDLIEALWPRGFVNEEALSRAVNELRSLLGDNARNPEFIKTIPKRGYRLIAATGEAAEEESNSRNNQSPLKSWETGCRPRRPGTAHLLDETTGREIIASGYSVDRSTVDGKSRSRVPA